MKNIVATQGRKHVSTGRISELIQSERWDELVSYLQRSGIVGKMLPELPLPIGTKVYLRTVTYHYIGILDGALGDWVCLRDTIWIADCGEVEDLLRTGQLAQNSRWRHYEQPNWVKLSTVVDMCALRPGLQPRRNELAPMPLSGDDPHNTLQQQ
jgi:hypothetical protein